jgi:hypothetical protein
LASLRFTFFILRGGIILYERKRSDRLLFEVAIDNKYEDMIPFIKELRESKRRIFVGGN